MNLLITTITITFTLGANMMEAISPKLHELLDAKMMLQDRVPDGFQLNYKLSGDVLCLFKTIVTYHIIPVELPQMKS